MDDETELASSFNVMSIPMPVVMKDGKVTKTFGGVQPKEQILSMLSDKKKLMR